MGLAERTLFRLLKDRTRRQPYRRAAAENGNTTTEAGLVRMDSAAAKAEYELLRLHFAENETVLKWILKHLDDSVLERMRFKDVFIHFRRALEQEMPLDRKKIVEELGDSPWRSLLSKILFDLDTGKAVHVELARDCLRTLRRRQLKEELQVLRQELRITEQKGGDVMGVMQKIKSLENALIANKSA